MKKFTLEFKQFIMRGNVLDLAIGIIIGGAFQKIVSSAVSDIAFPAITPLLGGIQFTEWQWGPIMIGTFLQATVDFLIIAFFVFVIVKLANRMKREEPAPETVHPTEAELLVEIRDLLKANK
ncbi:MAG: large conductance mechanosensitive channel protein MscL [Candidatus Pacebacteria bacterium]|jgi:large conductance mechanosensitive channel|nr:large conductance mechanosensitive channel protein MscL [Candidatus Paceibacterota bacterium]